MWQGNWNATTLLFSLNGLKENMMALPEVKYAGGKLVPRLDLRVGTLSRRTTSKEIIFNINVLSISPLGGTLSRESRVCDLRLVKKPQA